MSNNITNNYENSTWVEDWTNNLDTPQYIQSLIASGVNTVNIFVGQLDFDKNGNPVIDGFSEDTPGRPGGVGAFPNQAALVDFVSHLRAAGLNVKLSIGGQAGTTFGNSWEKLNPSNIQGFANALANICSETGANGIDFDDELEDTTIAKYAGQLAAAFKQKRPDLETSFCVFGGCGTTGPWHQVDEVFLQNARIDGQSAIDRVYVMSYYDGCSLQQNEQFMINWMNWLQTNCGIGKSQISCGVDPNDPTTSPNNGSLKAWIAFAAKEGFSTAIWDQQGVNDYIDHNWGNIIKQFYDSAR